MLCRATLLAFEILLREPSQLALLAIGANGIFLDLGRAFSELIEELHIGLTQI